MEARRASGKPTVMIRTYSSYNSIISDDQSSNHHQYRTTNTATKSDSSTELFIHQKQRSQTHKPNRILRYLNQIKGPNGSVRGHRDVVKKSLENIRAAASVGHFRNFNSSSSAAAANILTTFKPLGCRTTTGGSNNSTIKQLDEFYRLDYLAKLVEEEQDQCIAYTTTLGVIRRTFEDSKLMKSILNLNLIRYEERDIYLNQEYKLQLRMRCNSITVPALFVGGQHFGGIKELELMNENGKLSILLANFKMSKVPRGVCFCCGNAKFIACQSCNGSRKSAIHHFKFNSIALRCIKCDKNDGLVQCPVCLIDDDSSRYMDALTKKTLDLDVDGNNNDCNNNNNNIGLQFNLDEKFTQISHI